MGVFGVALATVTTTSVSEAAAEGEASEVARRAGASTSAAWMLAGASAVGLGILAEPVCSLVYQMGATGPEQVVAIASCLQGYVVGLAPYSLVKVLAPSFYAVDRPRVPLVASVTGVLVSVVFNALTFRALGAPGIALGTALGATANVLVLRIAFHRAFGPMYPDSGLRRLVALGVGLSVLAVASWGGGLGLDALREIESWSGATGKATLGAALSLVIAAAFLLYTAVLRAFGYPGAELLWRLPAGLWRRVRRR